MCWVPFSSGITVYQSNETFLWISYTVIPDLVHKPAFFLECLAGVKHASKFLAFSHQLMWVLRLPKSSSHPCAQRGCNTANPQTFFTLKKSVLCSRFSNFDATKSYRAGGFAAQWHTRMTRTFMGTSKLISYGTIKYPNLFFWLIWIFYDHNYRHQLAIILSVCFFQGFAMAVLKLQHHFTTYNQFIVQEILVD